MLSSRYGVLPREDHQLFADVVDLVRRDPQHFAEVAKAIDADYQSAEILARLERQADAPDVAFRTHERLDGFDRFAEQCGIRLTVADVLPFPGQRMTKAGRLSRRTRLSLRQRFVVAFADTFHPELRHEHMDPDAATHLQERRYLLENMQQKEGKFH